jgi:membrane-associated phospholipid phosphatase
MAFAIALALTVTLGFLVELGWASDGSTAFDTQITRWFVDHRTPTWTDAMRIVTWLGSSAVVIPLAILVVVVLLIGRQRWLALFVALAVGGASLLSVLTKDVIGRDRPPVDIRLQQAHSSSFPSGHSTQAAATYFALAIVVTVLIHSRAPRAVTWTVATLIVFLVGVSRVYLGMHWATDVLGGWLLGSVWVAGLSVAIAPLDTSQRSNVPGSRSGGAVLQTTVDIEINDDDLRAATPSGLKRETTPTPGARQTSDEGVSITAYRLIEVVGVLLRFEVGVGAGSLPTTRREP